jgi:hypothetical protein
MYEYALTPSLSLSFQRYPYPPAGVVTVLPRSWGALPFLLSAPHQLVLTCPDGEAFWIGLIPSPDGPRYRLRVLVSIASVGRVDALTGAAADEIQPVDDEDLAPRHGIRGIFMGDGRWWAFARDTGDTPGPGCLEIELLCQSAETAKPVGQTNDPGRQYAEPSDGDESHPSPSPPESRPPGTSPPHVEPQGTSSVRVQVVEPEHFEALGGLRVQPLREGNQYGGWRLP